MTKQSERNTHGRHSKLYAVDFFCGAGGMTTGLIQAGVHVVAGVDNDPSVGKTYAANHSPRSRFICKDVRECTGDDIRSWLPQGVHPDDLILVGCSPCQFWSHVNTDRTKAESGSKLLLEFGRIIREVKPGYVVAENVPGLMKAGKSEVFDPFIELLRTEGYDAVSYDQIRTTWFGVPQNRPRVLLLASRHHKEIHLPAHDRDLVPVVRDFIGVSQGFASLQAGDIDPADSWHRAAILSATNLRRIRSTPVDGGNRMAWRNTKLQLPTYMGRDTSFRNVYGRMWWDRPAPTLTTRFNSLSNGRFGHPDEDRAISVREGAALQTFPREYVFIGAMQSVCRQIGNAVPPALSQSIGSHLRQIHLAANPKRRVTRRRAK